jgi:hypothetical protein
MADLLMRLKKLLKEGRDWIDLLSTASPTTCSPQKIIAEDLISKAGSIFIDFTEYMPVLEAIKAKCYCLCRRESSVK